MKNHSTDQDSAQLLEKSSCEFIRHADGEDILLSEQSAGICPVQRQDYEELLLSPVGALSQYTDQDSRPLCGEAFITDPAFRDHLDLRRCSYAGSRSNHPLPMNFSALKQMTQNWNSILAAANALRGVFLADAARPPDSLALGLRIAYSGVCLPLYLMYRAAAPMRNGQVPGFVSGLHKASIDIVHSVLLMVLSDLQLHRNETVPLDSLIDKVLGFVEEEGLFIGERGVCAGPALLIRELLDVIVHGHGKRLEKYADAQFPFPEELGDLTTVRHYLDALIKIFIGKYIVISYNARLIDAIEAGMRAAGSDSTSLANIDRQSRVAHVSHIVARQERILRSLGADDYGRLLTAIEASTRYLTWQTSQTSADSLLQYVRTGLTADERTAAAACIKNIAGGSLTNSLQDTVIDALLSGIKMEQLALRFFSSTETDIRQALAMPGLSRPLLSADLAGVFGAMPSKCLGSLLDIEVCVNAKEVVLNAPKGTAALFQTMELTGQ